MKSLFCFLFAVHVCCFADCKEVTYIGSTPAGVHVKDFLRISLTDSVDFIRWKLAVNDRNFTLQCDYGICKPNTNGFIDKKEVNLSGTVKKEGNYYYLPNRENALILLELNPNLLHILNADKRLLVGNSGWSYVLNNTSPQATGQFNLVSKPAVLKDSVEFVGRTPCQPLADMLQLGKGPECYKKKWFIVFYVDPANGQPTTFLTEGIPRFRNTMKEGKWKIVQGKEGKVIYQLQYPGKSTFIYLLVANENVLYFTDADGRLLVGDEDFSYALNRNK
jgi:hypothetical protein